jgi:hypothetical protein
VFYRLPVQQKCVGEPSDISVIETAAAYNVLTSTKYKGQHSVWQTIDDYTNTSVSPFGRQETCAAVFSILNGSRATAHLQITGFCRPLSVVSYELLGLYVTIIIAIS